MNIAVIFAGGTGTRMNSKTKPKQFLEMNGKPIIIHTLEIFQKHKDIDAIVVACLEKWIPYLDELIDKFRINKVRKIIKGGVTGQESIFNALIEAEKIENTNDTIVLIHDGVRPLIDEDIISRNIDTVKEFGSSITSSVVKETIMIVNDTNMIEKVPDRKYSRIAKAPQSFYLKDILDVHRKAQSDGIKEAIDSCTLMQMYGKKLYMIDGPYENIKITTPDDFYIFRALLQAKEDSQIYGF